MEFNNIYLGDCLDVLKGIDSNSIDLVISDPPYEIFDNIKWDRGLKWDLLWTEINRIAKKDSAILIFASGEFKYKLYNTNPKMYKYELVWKKSKAGNPFNAKYMPLRKHEYILVFGKGKTKYNPQLVPGKPYKRDYTLFKKNNMGYGVKGVQIDNKGTRHPDMILDFPQKWRKQDQLHPTQKPVELLQWLIRSYSNKDDLILDPTMGSGSTLIAALKENRKYIGIDLNEGPYNITKQRLLDFQNNEVDYF